MEGLGVNYMLLERALVIDDHPHNLVLDLLIGLLSRVILSSSTISCSAVIVTPLVRLALSFMMSLLRGGLYEPDAFPARIDCHLVSAPASSLNKGAHHRSSSSATFIIQNLLQNHLILVFVNGTRFDHLLMSLLLILVSICFSPSCILRGLPVPIFGRAGHLIHILGQMR